MIEADPRMNVAYIGLSDNPVKHTSEFSETILIDLDQNNRIVGIELLDITQAFPLSQLQTRYSITDQQVADIQRLLPQCSQLQHAI